MTFSFHAQREEDPPVVERGSVAGFAKSEQLRRLAEEIRATGLHVTASRLTVLQFALDVEAPMSHNEVAEALAGEGWAHSTVYRNLIDLTEAGLLRRLSLGGTWRFEPASKEHPHFVCTECGSVTCANGIEISVTRSRNAPKSVRRGEFQVQLFGLCDACR